MSELDLTPLRLLSDDPIRDNDRDKLGLENWAKVVASAAVGNGGPLTIGVFGHWGVGKTSVLYLAKSLIDRSKQADALGITTVMFNAWQYEKEEMLLIPLIAAILQELDRKASKKKRRDGLRSALRSALYGMSVKAKGAVPMLGEVDLALDAAKAIERFETLRSHWIDQQMEQSLYFNAFQVLREAQRETAVEGRQQVVVFIDDLDRCFPNNAVRLLESVKLVLSEPGFVFVLAVDRRILESYLEKRFREEFGLKEYQQGQSYLAKFIQLPLWIPPHNSRFESFIDRILDEPALADYKKSLWPMRREISLACGFNPRQLVRFLNDLLVDQYIYRLINRHQRSSFPFEMFVVARGIRLQSDFVYQGLLKDHGLCEWIEQRADAETLRDDTARRLVAANPADGNSEVLGRIQAHEHLPAFLTSAVGKAWLREKEGRRKVEEFLSTERKAEESRGRDEFIQRLTERALTQILSEEPEAIISGCHLLSEVESPLRQRAVPRLVELLESTDEHVKEEAKRTLEKIMEHFNN